MFTCLLRKSNALGPDSGFDPSKHLRRRDITFSAGCMLVSIRWSKTIQFKQRHQLLKVPRLPHNILCPVQAVFLAFKRTQSARPDGPAFVRRIRQCLTLCGEEAHQYASHSFRRGGATSAYLAGVSGETIKVLGDWQSQAYQLYIQPSPDILSAAMQNILSTTKPLG